MNNMIRAALFLFFFLYSRPAGAQGSGVTYFAPSWAPFGEAVLSRAGGGFAELSAGLRRGGATGAFVFLGTFVRSGFTGASGAGGRFSAGVKPFGGPFVFSGALEGGKPSFFGEGGRWFVSPSVSLSVPVGGFAGGGGVLALAYRKAGAGDFTGSGLTFRFSVLF